MVNTTTQQDARLRRLALRLTQAQLAAAAGVHQVSVSRYEAGRDTHESTARVILEALQRAENDNDPHQAGR